MTTSRNRDKKFRLIFDEVPIPLWDEAFSEVKASINQL